jgi:aspartate aminotransferase
VYHIQLSKRAANIQPSSTLAIAAKAKQMKAEGQDVIGFGAGEPDFDTPDYIKRAGIDAIESGKTKYTPASGILELKKAVAKKFESENHIPADPSRVVVSCGAKHSMTNVCLALLDQGDEAIIPSPYWVSYPEMVKIAGAEPVVIETTEDTGFRLTPEALEQAITPNTKLLFLCSPSNPTGVAYHRKELEKLASVLEKKDVFVISDEIYEKLVYDGTEHVSIASLSPAMAERTITCNGVSKAFAMPGWRIGYAVGPAPIMKAAANLQSHSTSNPPSISQYAALAALNGGGEAVEAMRVEFEKRRNHMVGSLNDIVGMSCVMPQGAFYAFPNIKAHLGKTLKGKAINTSVEFAAALLDDEYVAVVPGIDFGAEGYLRFSYATDMESIDKGLERFARFCGKLQ